MNQDPAHLSDGDKDNPPALKISTLQRREIQAPLMAGLLEGFMAELGYEKAMQIASAAIQKDAAQAGRTMAKKYEGNSFKELLQAIREGWAEDGALEITLLEESGQKLSFDVTRCRYAEMYNRLGLQDFGFCLSCNRDSALIEGFNPCMQLLRTQTIMQGAATCDFRIVMSDRL